ncbi:MAG: type transport system permease protein, partial [Solirubrobacteraceae bacterium]|nr:type transport system permease protein [Solirubrobacteraceae bacterium]
VTIMIVGTIILSSRDEMTLDAVQLLDVMWRNLVTAAFLGALGVCLGALLRNQVAAIVGVLIVVFIIEPTLINLVPKVGRFTPIGGAPAGLVGADYGGSGDDLLRPGIAALVMVGWLVGLFASAGALLRRRDLT